MGGTPEAERYVAAYVGEPIDVLEQQQSEHKACLDPRPAPIAVERRDLAVEPSPCQPHNRGGAGRSQFRAA